MFLSLVVVLGCFVFDFVFRRGCLLPQESLLYLVVAGCCLWERKSRRNLGHGPPPSEPSTYSLDDADDDNDKDFVDDYHHDDYDDERPHPILILLQSWREVFSVCYKRHNFISHHSSRHSSSSPSDHSHQDR